MLPTCEVGQAPLREVGASYLVSFSPRACSKVLACTFPGKILSLKLRWGNFSEKPPSHIPGWGRDVMNGGSGEGQRPQGGLGDRGLPCCNAEFDYTAYPDYWPEPCSPGEGPGQKEDQGSGKGGPHIPRGTKGPQSETLLREGNPHSGGSQLHQVQGIQLDQPTCLPIMWHTASPGELSAATPPHWLSMLCGFVVLSSLSPSAMLGFAICRVTTRPGRRPIMDKETGCTPCQASGPPHCLIQFSAGVFNKGLALMAQGQVNLVVAHPQGASDATTSLICLAGMLVFATKGSTRADVIECVITLPWWPARRDSQHRLSKTRLCRVRPWIVVNLPRAVSDPSTARTCASLNQSVPNSGLTCAFTLRPACDARTSPRRADEVQSLWPETRVRPLPA